MWLDLVLGFFFFYITIVSRLQDDSGMCVCVCVSVMTVCMWPCVWSCISMCTGGVVGVGVEMLMTNLCMLILCVLRLVVIA